MESLGSRSPHPAPQISLECQHFALARPRTGQCYSHMQAAGSIPASHEWRSITPPVRYSQQQRQSEPISHQRTGMRFYVPCSELCQVKLKRLIRFCPGSEPLSHRETHNRPGSFTLLLLRKLEAGQGHFQPNSRAEGRLAQRRPPSSQKP